MIEIEKKKMLVKSRPNRFVRGVDFSGLLAGSLGVPAGGDESHRMRFLGEGVVVLPF